MSELPRNSLSAKTQETQKASNPLNPFALLRELFQCDRSGSLRVKFGSVQWNVELQQGKLRYVSVSVQSLEELNYHLRYLGWKEASEAIKAASFLNDDRGLNNTTIDQIIHQLEQQGFLSSIQVSQLAEQTTREALECFLWLSEGEYYWETNPKKESVLSVAKPLDIPTLLDEYQNRITSWQSFQSKIETPHQRAYLFNRQGENPSSPMLAKLCKLLRGLSIHQLAMVLKQDELKVAQMLYPYIESGEIFLRSPKSPWDNLPTIPQYPPTKIQETPKCQTWKIACVDDSPTILREMQRFLGEEKYEITKIENPIEAASTLFRVKPDLVLMDISMPEINGYKLCGLLRNSNALSKVPIIMVTSRTGVIDKVRAKTVGATDYLTKPFTKEELLAVVEKHLS